MQNIAIDLTPILPGGHNGGAKIMTLDLVKEMICLSPETQFILLASKKNYEEISAITAPNVKTICLSKTHLTLENFFILSLSALLWPLRKIANRITARGRTRLSHLHTRLRGHMLANELAKQFKLDLLFCPFTAPFYRDLRIPIVSVIYDLQSHYHPHFFTHEECYERKKHFEDACKWSKKLICISDYVKQTVIDQKKISAENVTTIHIRLAKRLPQINETIKQTILNRCHLTEENYLLYPANFWAHKNHMMLFTAFNMYRKQYPESKLKLICTGADNQHKTFLQNAITTMGLTNWINLPGFLSDDEFASLVSSCRAIIFPSLYEGFGMPVLEAMAAGKPVLCSNLTSLPEVAGSAALLFDPRKPNEIANAIYRIEHESNLIQHLTQLGHERVAEFGNVTTMAKEYLTVFHDALCAQP